jgi:hypothetical protein
VASPSRTRNPMSLQSIVLTGGGGNAMLTSYEEVLDNENKECSWVEEEEEEGGG